MATKPGERRLQILQTLATMLENPRGEKVTTAALAAKLDVSEAALYRHFASKAQMFEGLIEFIETTLFSLVNKIDAETQDGVAQAEQTVVMLLSFAEKNPGMTRVLIGDALVHEDERLQARINQLTDRLEAALRQSLRIAQAANALARRCQRRRRRADRLRRRPLAAVRQERLQAPAAGRLGLAAQVPVRTDAPLRAATRMPAAAVLADRGVSVCLLAARSRAGGVRRMRRRSRGTPRRIALAGRRRRASTTRHCEHARARRRRSARPLGRRRSSTSTDPGRSQVQALRRRARRRAARERSTSRRSRSRASSRCSRRCRECDSVDRLADWATRDVDNGAPMLLLAPTARATRQRRAAIALSRAGGRRSRASTITGRAASLEFWDYVMALPIARRSRGEGGSGGRHTRAQQPQPRSLPAIDRRCAASSAMPRTRVARPARKRRRSALAERGVDVSRRARPARRSRSATRPTRRRPQRAARERAATLDTRCARAARADSSMRCWAMRESADAGRPRPRASRAWDAQRARARPRTAKSLPARQRGG